MGEEFGYRVFTAVHIPLYALLIWGLFGGGYVNLWLAAGLDIFFVIHVFLHLIFIKHPEYRFRSAFSWALILGAGIFGVLDLVLP